MRLEHKSGWELLENVNYSERGWGSWEESEVLWRMRSGLNTRMKGRIKHM